MHYRANPKPSLMILGKTSLSVLILLLFFVSCIKESGADADKGVLFQASCDAEITTDDGKKFRALDDSSIKFKGGQGQVSDKARSGVHSLKVNKEIQFGFTIEIDDANVGDHFIVTVYRWAENDEGMLIAGNDDFWYTGNPVGEKDDQGWQKMLLDFYVPPTSESGEFKIYVWNPKEEAAYFDDITVSKVEPGIQVEFDEPGLYLYINEEGMRKLESIRKKAIADNILVTTDDSWVKAIFFHGADMLKAKVRLKGDWTDHLLGIKWSFRVKLKEGSWKGMRTFSIQHPKSRSNLDEWIAHKIFEAEDVLTTRYDFVPVFLNNQNLGLYAYEEHFEKQLVESRERREGPIIKLTEDQFWAGNLHMETGNLPIIESALIAPFKSSKLVQDSNLLSQFKVAQKLLYDYQFLKEGPQPLFDMERLARYIALMDLTKGFHGVAWHNQRFYYNPVISRLEPIAYDLYIEKELPDFMKETLLGGFEVETFFENREEDSSIKYLLSDSTLMSMYISYLEEYTNESYLDSIFASNETDILRLEKMIQKEDSYYNFEKELLRSNAAFVRSVLPSLSSTMYANLKGGMLHDGNKYNTTYYDGIPREYVRPYVSDKDTVRIENYYPDSIIVTGVKRASGNLENWDSSLSMRPYAADRLDIQNVGWETQEGDVLVFKVPGHEEDHEVELIPWPSPETYEIRRPQVNIPEEIFKINGKLIDMSPGEHHIAESVVIPEGFTLRISEGTSVDLTDGAFILSYSRVELNGTKESPIVFKSSDNMGLGLNVIQASGRSQIHHVNYSDMDAFRFDRWSLSGSLNMFESDADISELHISSNHCEDALNIIRSNFHMQDCSFSNIYADAFDSDFSTGNLSNTSFIYVGNDAIDFSGSMVEISDCDMKMIGDKGVSGGEGSTLRVTRVTVEEAKIGIASKDHSQLITSDCSVTNCEYGLVVFQKKPEYGPAYLNAQSLTWNEVDEPMLIEKGSKVKLNDKEILGKAKKVAERFY